MKVLQYSNINLKIMTIRKILSLIFVIFLIFPFTLAQTQAASASYTLTASVDKTSAKPGDTFEVTFTATNTGAAAISNFEIRVPFLRTVKDTSFVAENPSFNKLLESIEYPTGFQSRSWLINSFGPGEAKTFKAQYKIDSDPKTPNGLISNFTLPVTWVDPAGLPSNAEQKLPYLRADVYINKSYAKSYQGALPKLESLDNQVALTTLPSIYTYSGSKTTNLKSVTSANIKAFPNFTLETQDVLMEWTQPVDLSGADVAAKLNSLNTNLKPSWGKVEFSAANLAFLAKPVKLTFKETEFISEPKVRIGTEVKDFSESKGVFTENNRTTQITLDVMNTIALAPDIMIEQAVVESEFDEAKINGTVNDPRATVKYTVNGGEEKSVGTIDLQTGKFEIPVNVKDGEQHVEITATLQNKESTTKAAVAKLSGTTQATPTPTQTPDKISLPINQVTVGLLLLALAMISIIGGFIYYLYNRRKLNKKKNPDINLNPKVNKVSSLAGGKLSHGAKDSDILTPNSAAQKIASGGHTGKVSELKASDKNNDISESTKTSEPKIDLNELRKKYEIEPENDTKELNSTETK